VQGYAVALENPLIGFYLALSIRQDRLVCAASSILLNPNDIVASLPKCFHCVAWNIFVGDKAH